MSAVVRAIVTNGGPIPTSRDVEVPRANGYRIDADGRLILETSAWGGDVVAAFQRWDHFVITPDRGPNGRFIKKGS
ncbi:hypothetical protein [Mycobacteroides immunogenum]|uniref:Uncharacterized protein n=1 Tax=Mycobacteroides immunogenum TaxID=83262 RepID=A0A7V8LJT4_9MYCO|nr:hypothetical protein [Mycobacteroides immunogenum]AMT71951.1 hypothetical protein ABG82_18290 [Mycobacteroides immunogenum]ANO05083.1 hypothetical protein BAB75_18575 [Mycobacteroides immunogenum]KIU40243.1 hypothetical protein TL11_13390 [Mycobacteroides immunogenum]KPG02847.1 hypothetical protein AN909_26440 [Mycobacteroides immunogenum]KPG02935.1 hypothetical protein AN908_26890 [Mycobacteroides immunogenum]